MRSIVASILAKFENGNHTTVHLLDLDGRWALWHAPTVRFFEVTNDLAEILLRYETIDLGTNSADRFTPGFEKVQKALSGLSSLASEAPSFAPESRGIDKLVINVSHDCNLRCRYCYAHQGAYGREHERGLMSLSVASAIPQAFKDHPVQDIMFFGGEPLLNPQVIDKVCAGFAENQDTPPRFALVTNGTRFNEEVRQVILKRDIRVTVSLDGPKEIHDSLRPLAKGHGSFERVIATIDEARRILPNPVCFECTYTQVHRNAGITPPQLLRHLRDAHGLTHGVLGFCQGQPEVDGLAINLEEQHRYALELSDYYFTDMLEDSNPLLNEDWVRVLLGFTQRRARKTMCPVGNSMFAITPTGDVYPCHQFVVDSEYRLGNIFEDRIVDWQTRSKSILRINYKLENKQCTSCWLRYICAGCPAGIYHEEGSLSKIPEWFCRFKADQYLLYLSRLMSLRATPEAWARFVSGLQAAAARYKGSAAKSRSEAYKEVKHPA